MFFALWPDETLCSEIIARRALLGELGPRRIPDHNLHLTLVFLGNQPLTLLDDIEEIAGEQAPLKGDLELDHFGAFPRAHVAWLGGAAPLSLNEWVNALSERLAQAGVRFLHREFKPHVTLFRRVEAPSSWPECSPLRWPLANFSLIESIPSQPYQVLRTWSL